MEQLWNCKIITLGSSDNAIHWVCDKLIKANVHFGSRGNLLIPSQIPNGEVGLGVIIRDGVLRWSLRREIFNTVNLPEITIDQILNNMKQLPEKWCINRENHPEVQEWFRSNIHTSPLNYNTYCLGWYTHIPSYKVGRVYNTRSTCAEGYTEITFEEFEKLVLKKQNKITLPMGELELNCTTAPQKAKNITVGAKYKGVLIDSDDNQVDTWDEADYFLCNNNGNKEARYKKDLFELPVPPKPTIEDLEGNLTVTSDKVTLNFNGSNILIAGVGHGNLGSMGSNDFNCGILCLTNINSLWYVLTDSDRHELHINEFMEGQSRLEIGKLVFKAILEHKESMSTKGMYLYSTNYNYPDLIRFMDEWAPDNSSTVINPNSNRLIKLWTRYAVAIVEDPFNFEEDED